MSNSKILLLGILIVILLAGGAGRAYAEKIKITEKRAGEFTLLRATKPPLVCHRASRIGTISKKSKPVPGAVWQPYERATIERRIAALDRSLKKKGVRRSQRKTMNGERKALVKLMAAAIEVSSRCRDGNGYPDEGEFIGNPESLESYREHLSEREIQHLLERVAFGGTPALKQLGREHGLSALVDALVDGTATSEERTAFEARTDRWADMASWYDSDDLRGKRVWTTQAAQIGEIHRMIYSPEPLREWMAALLAAHFAVNLDRVGFSYNTYAHQGIPAHVALIRAQALGSIEDLAKAMLSDRAMNEWLDNKNNRAGEPNQNFARELLELFLLGEIDPLTHNRNYGEESIVASTAFVSGFFEDEMRDPLNGNDIMAIFYNAAEHDSGRYTVFRGIAGAETNAAFAPEDFISHILYQHPGSSRYLAERIGGQILYPGLSEAIVAPLAALLRENHFQLKPFLKRILKSAAFFSNSSRGACISAPVDHFIRLGRAVFPAQEPARGSEKEDRFFYSLWTVLESAADAGQRLFQPPSVFAWKGSCNINRSAEIAKGESWATMQRVLGRMRGCGELMNRLNWYELDLVAQFALTQRMGAFEIVEQVRHMLGVRALSEEEKNTLAQFMITELDQDGKRSIRSINLNEEWYVRRKIPRLVCLLMELSSTQVK